jgi:predicted nucleic acid-binding protein
VLAVDTNVLAYLLLEGDRTADAQALYAADADWRSEGFLLVEFSNVLATYRRRGALPGDAAVELLDTAQRVVSGLVNLPHARALALAAEYGVSAYDARFLGAAQALGTKLVTEDAKLRAAAPQLTRSIAQALAG